MGKIKVYSISGGESEKRDNLRDVDADERIVIKLILNK
jgi:hypothetical protein